MIIWSLLVIVILGGDRCDIVLYAPTQEKGYDTRIAFMQNWSIVPHENFVRKFQCKCRKRSFLSDKWKSEFTSNENGIRVINFVTFIACPILVLLWFGLVLESSREINFQVLIKFQLNSSEDEAKYHNQRFINLLILFGIWKNLHSSGRNLLLSLFINKMINHSHC